MKLIWELNFWRHGGMLRPSLIEIIEIQSIPEPKRK